MSCGVGCSCSSDPALLWLWYRPVAMAPIRPLAWESPYAVGAALEKDAQKNKRQKEKKKEKKKTKACLGVPLWYSRLRIWCYCSGPGHCCGSGLIPGQGTSTGTGGKKKVRETCICKKKIVFYCYLLMVLYADSISMGI